MDETPVEPGGDEVVTTTINMNERGDARIPAPVRRGLDIHGKEAILEITIRPVKIVDENDNGGNS